MKPELWHYGKETRRNIETDLALRDAALAMLVLQKHKGTSLSMFDEETLQARQDILASWRERLSVEWHSIIDHWEDYDAEEADKYLRYLEFLFILAGGEPCAW